MIHRKDNWDALLHAFIDSRVEIPFAWGSSDCATFVCDAIQTMTGTDVYDDFRGRYKTKVGAAKAIKSVCGGLTYEDAIEHVTKKFEMVEIPHVNFAQRGDVVLFDSEEGGLGTALGLVYFNGQDAIFVSPAGLKRIPVSKCRRAWVVGHAAHITRLQAIEKRVLIRPR